MSGHSKWSNTKHRKEMQDIKRGKIFTKLIKDIILAGKKNGLDPSKNHYLRVALEKAYVHNMSKKTINNAIFRNSCLEKNKNKESNFFRYSGYGPGGSAIIIECISNNRNRIVSKIRYEFSKFDKQLINYSNVKFLFKKKYCIMFYNSKDKDKIIEILKRNNSKKFLIKTNNSIELSVPIEKLKIIKKKCTENLIKIFINKPSFLPIKTIIIKKEKKNKLVELINSLKKIPDIENIYHNVQI